MSPSPFLVPETGSPGPSHCSIRQDSARTTSRGGLREALATAGPAVVECVIDSNEPPTPGHMTVEMAKQFAAALAQGDEHRWDIIKTVVADKIREVI